MPNIGNVLKKREWVWKEKNVEMNAEMKTLHEEQQKVEPQQALFLQPQKCAVCQKEKTGGYWHTICS